MKNCEGCWEKKRPPFATKRKEPADEIIKERLQAVLTEGKEAKESTLKELPIPWELRFFLWVKKHFPNRVSRKVISRRFKVIEVPDSWVYCECWVEHWCFYFSVFTKNSCVEICECSDGTRHMRTCKNWYWFMCDPEPCLWACG